LGIRYHLKDALGIAAGLHEFFRNSDLYFMANLAQTVNVLGCIKTNKTEASFGAIGLVLKMYREHYGTTPIEVCGSFAPLDIATAWKEERSIVTIGVINPLKESVALEVAGLGGKKWVGETSWVLTGQSPDSFNSPGQEPEVDIQITRMDSSEDGLSIPPLSVSLFEIHCE